MFGVDLKTPSEAALFPQCPLEPSSVEDYREEVMLSLSSARELAADRLKEAQKKSKKRYDWSARVSTCKYRIGEWVLVKFPADKTGRYRKLSQPSLA